MELDTIVKILVFIIIAAAITGLFIVTVTPDTPSLSSECPAQCELRNYTFNKVTFLSSYGSNFEGCFCNNNNIIIKIY